MAWLEEEYRAPEDVLELNQFGKIIRNDCIGNFHKLQSKSFLWWDWNYWADVQCVSSCPHIFWQLGFISASHLIAALVSDSRNQSNASVSSIFLVNILLIAELLESRWDERTQTNITSYLEINSNQMVPMLVPLDLSWSSWEKYIRPRWFCASQCWVKFDLIRMRQHEVAWGSMRRSSETSTTINGDFYNICPNTKRKTNQKKRAKKGNRIKANEIHLRFKHLYWNFCCILLISQITYGSSGSGEEFGYFPSSSSYFLHSEYSRIKTII